MRESAPDFVSKASKSGFRPQGTARSGPDLVHFGLVRPMGRRRSHTKELRMRSGWMLPVAAVLASSWWFSAGALAAPPTDEQVAGAIEKFKTVKPKSRDELATAANAVLDGLSVEELSAKQLDMLADARVFGGLTNELKGKLDARAQKLAEDQGADGAAAASVRPDLMVFPGPGSTREDNMAFDAKRSEAVVAAAKHPGLAAALKSGRAYSIFANAGTMNAKKLKDSGLLDVLAPMVTGDIPAGKIRPVMQFAQTAMEPDAGLDQPAKDKLADAIIASIDKGVPTLSDADPLKTYLPKQKKYFAGAYVRGRLLNHPAPKVDIQWASQGTPKSFADYKGKVVLVDFWATWCGPCVRAFPHMRDLKERYKDSNVEILGVTSVQGYHMARTLSEGHKPERIDCKDDPKKEMDLMPAFVKDMNMTWPVVFTDESCFNPDFGVMGIPHLAILDPDGKVRFNELRPSDPSIEDKIDNLLKEFKMAVPPPMEKKHEEKQGG
jgi:thiol-disulfide isomerase/thioredoxin